MIDEISLSVDEFVFVLFCLRFMQLKTYQLSMPRINRLTCLACLEGKYIVGKKKGCNTRTSQGVTHPSTTLAQARLTAEF